MGKFQEILTGWKNLLIRNPVVEKHALKRLEICTPCINNSTQGAVYMHSYCQLCHCILEAKSRNLETKCPNNLWLQLDQEEMS